MLPSDKLASVATFDTSSSEYSSFMLVPPAVLIVTLVTEAALTATHRLDEPSVPSTCSAHFVQVLLASSVTEPSPTDLLLPVKCRTRVLPAAVAVRPSAAA